MGRPTKFKEEYIEEAYNYSLLGATDLDLADFFDVAESTIYKWKLDYPAFSEALKEGKRNADAKVAQSLYKKALGYNADGKHIPADTTAIIFWLKNRQPEKWRDKSVKEHEGKIGVEQITGVVIK